MANKIAVGNRATLTETVDLHNDDPRLRTTGENSYVGQVVGEDQAFNEKTRKVEKTGKLVFVGWHRDGQQVCKTVDPAQLSPLA